MFNKVTKSIQYGAHTLTLETGEISRQADAAVMVSYGDTVVLVTMATCLRLRCGNIRLASAMRFRPMWMG